jgi:hypothetical protein
MVGRVVFIRLGTGKGVSKGRCSKQSPDGSPLDRSETEAGRDDRRDAGRDESPARQWTRTALCSGVAIVAAVTGCLMGGSFGTPAFAQTPGAVYAFHSDAVGNCPSLEWSIVVGGNNTLSGIIAWDSMRKMARAFGTVAADKSFHMDATDVTGGSKSVVIDGQLTASGWLIAAIKGPGIDCQNIEIPMDKPVGQ